MTILIFLLCTALAVHVQSVDYTLERSIAAGADRRHDGLQMHQGVVPQKPMRKSEKALLSVTFDANQAGVFNKPIIMHTNATKKLAFRICGSVKK